MSRYYIFIAVLAVIVFGVSITGFVMVGTPTTRKLIEEDKNKLRDFDNFRYQVENSYYSNKAIPESIDEITLYSSDVDNKFKNGTYKYEKLSADSYNLCTTFSTDAETLLKRTGKYEVNNKPTDAPLKYKKGYDCIKYQLVNNSKPIVFTPTSSPKSSVSPTITSTSSSDGTIEGSFGYPSEGIPPGLKACAENQTTKKEYCTAVHIKDKKYKYGEGYKLQVPEGTYFVYVPYSGNPSGRAYYNGYDSCSSNQGKDCSHTPISVSVKKDEVTQNVDPIDFYERY